MQEVVSFERRERICRKNLMLENHESFIRLNTVKRVLLKFVSKQSTKHDYEK